MDEVTEDIMGKKIISVGDSISYILLKNGIEPDVLVYDKKEKREESKPEKRRVIDNFCVAEISVKNPPSTIKKEVWEAVKDSLKMKEKVKIFVEGEEDLLVLPFVIEGDESIVILYGLSGKGFVLVKIDKFIKEKCTKLLEKMTMGR